MIEGTTLADGIMIAPSTWDVYLTDTAPPEYIGYIEIMAGGFRATSEAHGGGQRFVEREDAVGYLKEEWKAHNV